MAATRTEDQMRSIIYDTSHYPKFFDLISSDNLVSELLLRLLSHLIKSSKSKCRLLSLSAKNVCISDSVGSICVH